MLDDAKQYTSRVAFRELASVQTNAKGASQQERNDRSELADTLPELENLRLKRDPIKV